jgi:uncharacterized protein YkwD
MPLMPRFRNLILPVLCTGLLLPAAAEARPHLSGHWTTRAAHAAQPTSAAHSARQDCAGADLQPDGDNGEAIRSAVVCLENQIRDDHGLPTLRANTRLRAAADGHSANMVARRFFDHTAPGGVTMVDRIFRAHYASRNSAWSLGENLAWGTGSFATPRHIVEMWMDSPGHRANILKRAYREIGVGVALGTPSGGSAGATYTTDFGVIRR